MDELTKLTRALTEAWSAAHRLGKEASAADNEADREFYSNLSGKINSLEAAILKHLDK